MTARKIKFDSSKFKNEENEMKSSKRIKADLEADNTEQQIETLNKNQILLKAAQNFFKEKTGDEQKPVKDSIRIFNNFRIRSSSPQQQQNYYYGKMNATTSNVTIPLMTSVRIEDNKYGSMSNSQVSQALNSSNNINQMFNKADLIAEGSTSQVQQNITVKNNFVGIERTGQSQSPTKQLQKYQSMRDQVNLQMTKKQSKKNFGSPDSRNNNGNDQKNKSEWILSQINKFSPQLVLKLNDPIIIQSIKNLNLTIEEMKDWIQVSDFYSIQESTRMQMRRYLTALNETFYKIESVIQERNRIIQLKIKEKNDRSAQHKQEKFFQSFTSSKYYRELDAQRSSSLNGRSSHFKNLQNNKIDFVNSLSLNIGADSLHEPSDPNYQQSKVFVDHSPDKRDDEWRKNKNVDGRGNKNFNASYSPQKQSQTDVLQNKQTKLQTTEFSGRQIEDLQLQGQKHSNIGRDNHQIISNHQIQLHTENQQTNELGGVQTINKDEITEFGVLHDQSNDSINQKEIPRFKFSKQDLDKKLQQKIQIEQRLTNLQLNEALKYEEEQNNLQQALKKKKLLSGQRRDKELKKKVDKIKQRNNFIEEKKNNYVQQKKEDENRRYQMIKEFQQEDTNLQNIKDKKEEIKNLQQFERDKQTQLKQQVMKDQQKTNTDDLVKKNKEEIFRIQESIEFKNSKQQNILSQRQDRSKNENVHKAEVLLKHQQQLKQLEEQIVAEVARKYDKSADFIQQLQKKREQQIQEINKEFDRKQQENNEKLQSIKDQEKEIRKTNAKLLSARISSSELSRKQRIESLKQQISQNNLNKANKTMESFYHNKEVQIEKNNQYLKTQYENRDAYLDDQNTYQQYLKKCNAIRINQSFQREQLTSSPKKVRQAANQNIIRTNQFKNTDHSF